MHAIAAPQKPRYISLGEYHGKFEILGCHPGYGTTLGNALRRILLSSLDGAAAKSVKIKGVSHEFSTIEGVMEDVVQIILNLKQVRFKLHGDEPVKITLKNKGEGPVTAGMFKTPSSVEVVNPDQIVATVTDKKAGFELEVEVDRGLGYVPVESREREEREIGVIAIDAIYTPVKRVNYEVENMRVGKRTDYDKITLEVVTDGSCTPIEAFQKSVGILVTQFSSMTELASDEDEAAGEETAVNEEVIPVAVDSEEVGNAVAEESEAEKKPKKAVKKKTVKEE